MRFNSARMVLPALFVVSFALAADEVTFTKDVAPILQRACQNCHRPAAIAPMPLLTYQDARPWARSIKEKVLRREMPPWYIDRNIGISRLKDDPSLSDAEIAVIAKWVDHGSPAGNPADMPPPRQFSAVDKWHIGKPDLIVSMPKPYKLKASGPDVFYDIDVDPGFTEDLYVQAVETKPEPEPSRLCTTPPRTSSRTRKTTRWACSSMNTRSAR